MHPGPDDIKRHQDAPSLELLRGVRVIAAPDNGSSQKLSLLKSMTLLHMQLFFRLYATVELVYIVCSIQLEKADSVQFPAAKIS